MRHLQLQDTGHFTTILPHYAHRQQPSDDNDRMTVDDEDCRWGHNPTKRPCTEIKFTAITKQSRGINQD